MDVKSAARLILITFILCISVEALADVHGVLRVVKGDVEIKSAQTGQTTKARLGQEIFPKDTIITGKDGGQGCYDRQQRDQYLAGIHG